MDVDFLKYRFEDGYDGIIVKNKFRLGVRHVQVAYMVVCAAVMGALRGSAGVAVLAMADVSRNDTDQYIQIHPWDRRVQGKLLSSFFIGYALLLVPAALLARRAGGKAALSASLLCSGALTVAMPTIANRGGWVAVYNAQLWLGAAQATLAPASAALLVRWLPPNERGVFSCLIHSGVLLGIIIGMPISGMISEARLGWELIFYSQAMMTLSMAAIWGLLTASTPDSHQAVGDTEKEYIREASSYYRKKAMQVPWRSILKSRHFWAIACAHAASSALFVFYLTEVPAFLQTFGMSLRESSCQAALPLAALWLAHAATAPTLEWLCRLLQLSFRFDVTRFRKLLNTLGAVGVTTGLAVVPSLTPAWPRLALATLAASLGSLGFQFSGFLENCRDLSQNFPGSVLTLSSAVASAAGALVPLLAGAVLADEGSDGSRWGVVFFSLAGLYAACNVGYAALGSSERQPWDGGAVVKGKFGYHNRIVDTAQLELDELTSSELKQHRPGT